MDDQNSTKRKNILLGFLGFIVVFLFLYKGVFLKGDEYLDKISELTTSNSKTSSLKKNKSETSTVNDNEKKLEKKFYSDLNINLEWIESDVKEFKTSITNYIEKHNLSKEIINVENLSVVLEKVQNSKDLIKDFQNKKLNDKKI